MHYKFKILILVFIFYFGLLLYLLVKPLKIDCGCEPNAWWYRCADKTEPNSETCKKINTIKNDLNKNYKNLIDNFKNVSIKLEIPQIENTNILNLESLVRQINIIPENTSEITLLKDKINISCPVDNPFKIIEDAAKEITKISNSSINNLNNDIKPVLDVIKGIDMEPIRVAADIVLKPIEEGKKAFEKGKEFVETGIKVVKDTCVIM